MSQITITKCDQCGGTKGVDNCWLILWEWEQQNINPAKGYSLIEAQYGRDHADVVYDLCSTECLKLKLNELRKPIPTPPLTLTPVPYYIPDRDNLGEPIEVMQETIKREAIKSYYAPTYSEDDF